MCISVLWCLTATATMEQTHSVPCQGSRWCVTKSIMGQKTSTFLPLTFHSNYNMVIMRWDIARDSDRKGSRVDGDFDKPFLHHLTPHCCNYSFTSRTRCTVNDDRMLLKAEPWWASSQRLTLGEVCHLKSANSKPVKIARASPTHCALTPPAPVHALAIYRQSGISSWLVWRALSGDVPWKES